MPSRKILKSLKELSPETSYKCRKGQNLSEGIGLKSEKILANGLSFLLSIYYWRGYFNEMKYAERVLIIIGIQVNEFLQRAQLCNQLSKQTNKNWEYHQKTLLNLLQQKETTLLVCLFLCFISTEAYSVNHSASFTQHVNEHHHIVSLPPGHPLCRQASHRAEYSSDSSFWYWRTFPLCVVSQRLFSGLASCFKKSHIWGRHSEYFYANIDEEKGGSFHLLRFLTLFCSASPACPQTQEKIVSYACESVTVTRVPDHEGEPGVCRCGHRNLHMCVNFRNASGYRNILCTYIRAAGMPHWIPSYCNFSL